VYEKTFLPILEELRDLQTAHTSEDSLDHKEIERVEKARKGTEQEMERQITNAIVDAFSRYAGAGEWVKEKRDEPPTPTSPSVFHFPIGKDYALRLALSFGQQSTRPDGTPYSKEYWTLLIESPSATAPEGFTQRFPGQYLLAFETESDKPPLPIDESGYLTAAEKSQRQFALGTGIRAFKRRLGSL